MALGEALSEDFWLVGLVFVDDDLLHLLTEVDVDHEERDLLLFWVREYATSGWLAVVGNAAGAGLGFLE